MSEKKEKVGGLKNTAVKKEDLPVVTQLFTPKWIVQYMVQNSLGKLYDEKYEDNQLAKHWEYYLKHEENVHLYPEFDSLEDLKIMDPACGSGHILLYAFDMLYDMYEEAGYPSRDIPMLILENNLFGLDIDKRAQQIANFALLMKAAEKQPRFISRLSRKGESPKINVFEIVDADSTLSKEAIDYFAENEIEKSLIVELLDQFENGKQFGSLINPIEIPYEEWINRINDFKNQQKDLIEESYFKELEEKLLPVLMQANLLYQKYDVVVTNPPYHNKYNPELKRFIHNIYESYKSDLFSAFIYKTCQMTKENGYSALMTPFTWMFISRHEKLRTLLISKYNINSLIQLEYSAFTEATVPICTFVIQNQNYHNTGVYVRLSDFSGPDIQPIKVKEAAKYLNIDYKYYYNNNKFLLIPGNPIVYWVNEKIINLFESTRFVSDLAFSDGQTLTGNNQRFLRLWWEIDKNLLNRKWRIHLKGGKYRKWSGNVDYVIDWSKEALKYYKENKVARLMPEYLWYREGICWSMIGNTENKGFRYVKEGYTVNLASQTLFFNNNEDIMWVLGFLNSIVGQELVNIINPTLNLVTGDVLRIPIPVLSQTKREHLSKMAKSAVELSDNDWDLFEESLEFKKHPLLKHKNNDNTIGTSFKNWKEYCENQFEKLKQMEEEINKEFIELLNLQKVLSPIVDDDKVSVTLTDQERDTKSFLSYFIGCIMGRYSLDLEGLVYAGGDFYGSKYKIFKPNPDGLILLTEEHYFENDIIVRLREFLSVAFSPDTVDENMNWLAESLGLKKNESPEERLRRYFLDEFFKDHCQTYQKRPIYWLVDSGKQKGLRTLIYMHRYQPDTMATIRFDHLQEIQEKYQNEIERIDTRLANPKLSATDRRNLEKAKTTFQKKIEELQEFDKHLAFYANNPIEIDLDDGVKVNYAKFDKVLAKIK